MRHERHRGRIFSSKWSEQGERVRPRAIVASHESKVARTCRFTDVVRRDRSNSPELVIEFKAAAQRNFTGDSRNARNSRVLPARTYRVAMTIFISRLLRAR